MVGRSYSAEAAFFSSGTALDFGERLIAGVSALRTENGEPSRPKPSVTFVAMQSLMKSLTVADERVMVVVR